MPPDPLEEEHASHALSALRALYARRLVYSPVADVATTLLNLGTSLIKGCYSLDLVLFGYNW